ncbi:FtsX-like permease family protein [Enterococcus rivorum]|uniref:Permease n=1 Tax=Enterococcus rivorum TaxID=762845 RepID=A0A1E5KZQ6_9ENTE|nr:FtsX-like permease family protein [Enterococcus rivorum]MBP2099314.1 putative ABC transport system permease protein [Enterococcus rivorum]OEH83303.1 permease [Enterococcus rivorum]
MNKKALIKTSLREIRQSKTRFFSIFGIIFLGVMVFVGLKATGPDMTQTANNYYQKQKLPDARVISTLGLTDKDLDNIRKVSTVKAVLPRYTKDIAVCDRNLAVKFVSYDLKEKQPLLSYSVVKGRMPEKSGEIVLDEIAETRKYYKLGDTLSVSEKDDEDNVLKQRNFKVVGFVRSPEYIENMSRGNTTIGKGTLDFFAVVPKADMTMSAYTEMLVSFADLEKYDTYSNKYEENRTKNIDELKNVLKNRPQERVTEIRQTAQIELDQAKKEISDGETALKDGEIKLQSSKEELDKGKQQLADAKASYSQQIGQAESQLATSQTALDSGEAELATQQALLATKKNELAAATPQVEQGRQALVDLQAKRDQLNSQKELLIQQFNGYQGVAYSVAGMQMIPDDQLPEAITNAAPQWIAALKAMQAPDELLGAVQQLLANPTKTNIAIVMGAFNNALSFISSQQQQVDQGIQVIDQQIQPIQQSIAQYEAGQQQIADGEAQLAQASANLAAGKEQLAVGRQQLEQSKIEGQAKIDDAQAKLNEGQAAYDQGLAKFEKEKSENVPKLKEAKGKVQEQEKKLADLAPADYYYLTREDNPGFSEYEDNANRISSLSTVFPVFFFLIAALVSLTTMTRMVEEKRMEIGSLKALGYRNGEIAFKFLTYAVLASLSGAVLGLIVGYYLFPTIIFDAYGQLYNIPDFVTPWYLDYSVIAILVAVLCTAGAAMVVLRIDLFSTPASLLRPKAPKIGKRIFLERIRPLWHRMSFIEKVTARNLFRYKQRMLMTVLGIAGCMALVITGFGLKDSISDVVNIQFNKIFHYQAVVSFNKEASIEENKEYEEALKKVTELKNVMPMSVATLQTTSKDVVKQNVTVYVPEKVKEMDQFVLFNDRQTKKKYYLSDDGVIINEKLANLFQFKIGDTLLLKDGENRQYKLKIAAVVENYTGHFAYMSPDYYQKVFSKVPQYNNEFLLFDKKLTKGREMKVGEDLMSKGKVLNISFLSSASDALDDTIHSLNIVVWVLIIVSGLLAFIVLYNLTNINVSERIRELSTIKVLGFYDNEVTMYVYRENIILTLMGIIVGCFFGKVVHSYVLSTVEVDMLMFSPTIHWMSYLYSALITLFFTLLVMVIMHRKLKKVDMIEALKANE